MKIAIYARVSTTNKGQDLDTQLLPLQAFAEARGWVVSEVYADEMSGAKEDRPALLRLMQDAHKRRFDAVLVFRFDRFARSTKQLIQALETFRALGIEFVSYQEAVDTTTPAGKVMFTMIAAFAEFERAIIKERVKAGIAKARQQGKPLGRPKREIDQGRVADLRQQGLSLRAIARELGVSKSLVAQF